MPEEQRNRFNGRQIDSSLPPWMLANASTPAGIAPGAPKQNVFEQAGTLQSTAATAGADAEIAGLREAIAQLQQMMGGNNPFNEAGLEGLQGVQQGSTAMGFNDRLNAIMGGDQFGALVDERQRGLQGQLAAGGLTRSARLWKQQRPSRQT